MKFEKVNTNPKGHRNGDCSIRAISKATDKEWIVVFDELYKIGRLIFCLQNDIETIKIYLKDFKHSSCKAIKGKKRLVVKDFNTGTYILRIANHITCVKDNVLYDLWDCRDKCVYRYWKIK